MKLESGCKENFADYSNIVLEQWKTQRRGRVQIIYLLLLIWLCSRSRLFPWISKATSFHWLELQSVFCG